MHAFSVTTFVYKGASGLKRFHLLCIFTFGNLGPDWDLKLNKTKEDKSEHKNLETNK